MSSARINKTVRIIYFARRLKFQTLHSSWIFLYLYHHNIYFYIIYIDIYLFTYLNVNLSIYRDRSEALTMGISFLSKIHVFILSKFIWRKRTYNALMYIYVCIYTHTYTHICVLPHKSLSGPLASS